MKVKTKILVGFITIFLFTIVLVLISISSLNQVGQPLNENIPDSISNLEKGSYLDGLAQFIRYYDEVLTQSARNYAFTSDVKWKERYESIVPELDKIIKESIEKGDEQDAEYFLSVDEANIALVEMEENAIALVDNGNSEESVRILESNAYWDQKRVYEQGLRDYVARRGLQYDEALLASTQALDATIKETESLIKKSKNTIIFSSVIILIIVIFISFTIAKSVSEQIVLLTKDVGEITKGNFDKAIEVRSSDEVGELTKALMRITASMKLAILRTGIKKEEMGIGIKTETKEKKSLITQTMKSPKKK